MSSLKRNIVGSLVVLGITAGLIAWQLYSKDPAKDTESDLAAAQFVTTTRTERGNWHPMHAAIGLVEAARQLDLQAEVSARVSQLSATPGMTVDVGDPIVTLDDTDARRELRRLQSQLQEMQANQAIQARQHQLDLKLLLIDRENLVTAQKSLQRWQSLNQKSLSSASQLDQARLDVAQRTQGVLQRELSVDNHAAQRQQMEASLSRLELAIEAQRALLDKHHLVADIRGTVANLELKIGQQVSPGQHLFTLFDNRQLLFKTQVSTQLAQQVDAQLDYQGNRYQILHTNPMVQNEAAGQSVWFDLQGADALPGSHQYATWVSPAIPASFLVTKRALQDFERVYYLQPATRPVSADEADTKAAAADGAEAEPDTPSRAMFELAEAKVTLHGSTVHNGQEYWIVTSDELPASAELLTSKLEPLYAGLLVTKEIPDPKTVLSQSTPDKRGQ